MRGLKLSLVIPLALPAFALPATPPDAFSVAARINAAHHANNDAAPAAAEAHSVPHLLLDAMHMHHAPHEVVSIIDNHAMTPSKDMPPAEALAANRPLKTGYLMSLDGNGERRERLQELQQQQQEGVEIVIMPSKRPEGQRVATHTHEPPKSPSHHKQMQGGGGGGGGMMKAGWRVVTETKVDGKTKEIRIEEAVTQLVETASVTIVQGEEKAPCHMARLSSVLANAHNDMLALLLVLTFFSIVLVVEVWSTVFARIRSLITNRGAIRLEDTSSSRRRRRNGDRRPMRFRASSKCSSRLPKIEESDEEVTDDSSSVCSSSSDEGECESEKKALLA